MQELYIDNLHNEIIFGEKANIDESVLSKLRLSCGNMLWFAKEGDIFLLPTIFPENFLNYVFDILQVDKKKITLITPNDNENSLVNTETLLNPDLIKKLKKIMGKSEWRLVPRVFDSGIALLIRNLEINYNKVFVEKVLRGLILKLNRKSYFRSLLSNNKIPTTYGIVSTNFDDFMSSFSKLINETGSIILKQDLNNWGKGNIIISKYNYTQKIGAVDVIVLNDGDDTSLLREVWERWSLKGISPVTVEVYYANAKTIYLEYELEQLDIKFLSFGFLRMNPQWTGFDVPRITFRDEQLSMIVKDGKKIAECLLKDGYQGHFSINALLVEGTLKPLWIDLNCRESGCTSLHYFCERMYGVGYQNEIFIIEQNRFKVNDSIATFNDVINILLANELLWTRQNKVGVIIVSEEVDTYKLLNYRIVARDSDEASVYESKLSKLLS